MRLMTRTRRVLVGAAAGALALSLLPAGAASASLHEDVCEGVPEDVFTDVATGNVHAAQIDCIAALGITLGVGDDAYDPGGDVRRDQMATFLVNLAEVARGEAFEAPDGDVPFTDIEGNTHADNIAIAFEEGIALGVTDTTYEPSDRVSRAQMASFVARTITTVGGTLDDAAPDAFTDDDGNVHESNIDALAAAGVVSGVGGDRYDPAGDVRRDQMATFLANGAGLLNEQDRWAPSPPAVDATTSALTNFEDDENGSTAELTFTVQDVDGDPITTADENYVAVNVDQLHSDREARYGLDRDGDNPFFGGTAWFSDLTHEGAGVYTVTFHGELDETYEISDLTVYGVDVDVDGDAVSTTITSPVDATNSSLDGVTDDANGHTAELTFTVRDDQNDAVTDLDERFVSVNVAQEGTDREARYGLDRDGDNPFFGGTAWFSDLTYEGAGVYTVTFHGELGETYDISDLTVYRVDIDGDAVSATITTTVNASNSALTGFTDLGTGSTAALTFTVRDNQNDPVTDLDERFVSVNVAQEGTDREARYSLDRGGDNPFFGGTAWFSGLTESPDGVYTVTFHGEQSAAYEVSGLTVNRVDIGGEATATLAD